MAEPISIPPIGARARLFRDPRFRWGIFLLIAMALAAMAGPFLLPDGAGEVSPDQYVSPSAAHPFGTDLTGRDLLARVLQGARISLLVGLCGAMVSLFIGTCYGMIAGYFGGRVDSLMMRTVDILYSVPRLIVILVCVNTFDARFRAFLTEGPFAGFADSSRILILIIALGLIEWLTMARIVRGQVLALRNMQFVAAARALGQSHAKIIFRHLLPNVSGVILVYLTLTVPAVILDESFLSFLGLGVQPPQASWGSLLTDGATAVNPVKSYWWLLVFPAMAMFGTLLALNFIGDSLRDALDPKSRAGKIPG